MSSISLDNTTREQLIELVKASILHGLQHNTPLMVEVSQYSAELRAEGASFVTLHKNGELRGCIGTLEAYQPLVQDIATHAFDAAFKDPRFPPLRESEFDQLEIEISILGKPEPIQFSDEEELLQQIRPGIDGLILESGFHRGTFLPSVWEQLPGKTDFLNHLKMKAGLPANWWDNSAKVSRYETVSFH